MSKNSKLEELLDNHPDVEFLLVDGFDDAIVGVDNNIERLVYDYEYMVSMLMMHDGMERGDAIEHLEYNVVNSYVGEKTPIYINLL